MSSIAGFDDAVKYLQRHNLISCTRCLAVKSSFDITISADDDKITLNSPMAKTTSSKESSALIDSHPYDGCDDCKLQIRMADQASLPELIREPMLQAAKSENSGIVNWLFKHRPVKVNTIGAENRVEFFPFKTLYQFLFYSSQESARAPCNFSHTRETKTEQKTRLLNLS